MRFQRHVNSHAPMAAGDVLPDEFTFFQQFLFRSR
jgi:hypothetical protein